MPKIILFCCLLLGIGFMSCRKKPLPTPVTPNPTLPTKGAIRISVNNVVTNKPLALGGLVSYTLANGEIFTVDLYEYYLSNFVFVDDKGNKFMEPESYYLITTKDPQSLTFTIKDIPFGNYKSIEFLIGVDSIRNFSGAQTGALDPKYGMFWSWNSGYIMARLEGTSTQSSAPNGLITYHIGGFKGTYNVLHKVSISLPQNATITEQITPIINIQSEVATWFKELGLNPFSFNKTPIVTSEGQNAYLISQNYKAMFSVTSVKN